MGNGTNLPQHGNPKTRPRFAMLKDFTENNLRRQKNPGLYDANYAIYTMTKKCVTFKDKTAMETVLDAAKIPRPMGSAYTPQELARVTLKRL